MLKLATTVLGAAVAIIVLIAAVTGTIASMIIGPAAGNAGDCAATALPNATTSADVDRDRLTNAATIVAVGTQLGVPVRGQVVTVTAAITESGLENLDHGDRDSLGLFQERPSQGWGTQAQIMNPGYAATQFYRHLLAIHGWQQMSVNDAAQAVEESGRPTAYAPHEPTARQIVAAVQGVTCTAAGAPASASQHREPEQHIHTPTLGAQAVVNYVCSNRTGGVGAEMVPRLAKRTSTTCNWWSPNARRRAEPNCRQGTPTR